MKHLFLVVLISVSLISCKKEKSENMQDTINDFKLKQEQAFQLENNNVTTTQLSYKVTNREIATVPIKNDLELKKLMISIDIPSEYSETQLKEIANVLKNNEPYEYFNFEFYLETQPKTGLNYGNVNITPAGTYVTVNHVPIPREPEKSVKKPFDGCTVYGAWDMIGAKVIAYQKNGRCYMVNYYGDSNYGDPELYYKTTFGGHTAFENAEDPADMYVINSNGDLDGYNDGDLVITFRKSSY